ncbi:hypothetical protein CYMTET_42328 [Cymbomonas tetramitiformis]|uniref:Uncharacterized protein n=1 Tax=Cymbomonas tetramitiformis TaxID=36881 RepID=A0AAE0C4C8_9CHLO|nr:hypothetical protein CYMTET_42328 [Cymbomonas tetramitiformis]
MPKMRCTIAAAERLESEGVCHVREEWEDPEHILYKYFKCLHPNEYEGGMMMHSYVYINGEFMGNGFALLKNRMSQERFNKLLVDAHADRTCTKTCDSFLPPSKIAEVRKTIATSPVALYGWAGCPCTSIARQRFQAEGVCYAQNVWPEPDTALFRYLQCLHGPEHHSFVFIAGEFVGNGFDFDPKDMSRSTFMASLQHAGARLTCQKEGDLSLYKEPLQPCTQGNDGSTTGWTRTGSCNWDPSDTGYHEVCVTMSDHFLAQSARHDANDLRSVTAHGGHWCICAWAFASAVERDPKNLEGIRLECNRTNLKLREVYEHYAEEGKQLVSPGGISYEAQKALDAVNQICGTHPSELSATPSHQEGAASEGKDAVPNDKRAAIAAIDSSRPMMSHSSVSVLWSESSARHLAGPQRLRRSRTRMVATVQPVGYTTLLYSNND